MGGHYSSPEFTADSPLESHVRVTQVAPKMRAQNLESEFKGKLI